MSDLFSSLRWGPRQTRGRIKINPRALEFPSGWRTRAAQHRQLLFAHPFLFLLPTTDSCSTLCRLLTGCDLSCPRTRLLSRSVVQTSVGLPLRTGPALLGTTPLLPQPHRPRTEPIAVRPSSRRTLPLGTRLRDTATMVLGLTTGLRTPTRGSRPPRSTSEASRPTQSTPTWTPALASLARLSTLSSRLALALSCVVVPHLTRPQLRPAFAPPCALTLA